MSKRNRNRKKGIDPKILACRVEDIMALEIYDFEIEEQTPYQFRINDCIDLYPVHFKYHNLDSGERGFYPKADIIGFIHEEIEKKGNGRCECGGRFVERRNKSTQQKFLGCTNYPECKITKPFIQFTIKSEK